jgi:hypothetical protein
MPTTYGGKKMDKLLNMLVVFINARIRECKLSLETEEKSKEIAYLQGRITGYRTLLCFLKGRFNLSSVFMEDNSEEPTDIGDLPDRDIAELALDIISLELSEEWSGVKDDIGRNAEELKEFLLSAAENARDLYFSQAQYAALTCFETLFTKIKNEQSDGEKRLREELPF